MCVCVFALTFRSFHHFWKPLGNCIFWQCFFTPSFVIYSVSWFIKDLLISSDLLTINYFKLFLRNILPLLTWSSTPKGRPNGRNAKWRRKSLCLTNLIFVFNLFKCWNNVLPKDILLMSFRKKITFQIFMPTVKIQRCHIT